MMLLTRNLMNWYYKNARSLPWRFNQRHDPPTKDLALLGYKVLVSEFMLQQTTVKTVIPYYTIFITSYPTIACLAKASQEDILKCWSGLGYYSRARNLHRCAIELVDKHRGILPDDFDILCSLPGIGRYTAGALSTLVHDKKAPAIDANVKRVIARIICHNTPLKNHEKAFEQWALEHCPNKNCGDFTQALIELGACICKPRSPHCHICPVNDHCLAYAENKTTEIPVKKNKPPSPKRYAITYILETSRGDILLSKRPEKGILAGMRETPMTDFLSTKPKKTTLLKQANTLKPEYLATLSNWKKLSPTIKHVFTHFTLEVLIVYIHLDTIVHIKHPDIIWVKRNNTNSQALSRLVQKILTAYFNTIPEISHGSAKI